MMMTFFTSSSTPLFAENWTPSSTGQYVGTCIFLIVLAVIFRGLVAVRCSFNELYYRYTHRQEPSWRTARIGQDEKDRNVQTGLVRGGWTVEEAVPRAVLDTILAGVSYLLMLAVMTMNVGYFLSILGGVFLGSLCFGHFANHSAVH
ncbi:Ctr copper transporter [Elsinoe ampelina]|uniref:Copper transport protein n=1 Tax=Elsinoe ampelina TaxID=302913 RepID=A0A6A6G6V3_9PEZI|nr:Ctr copper transporter [Elsinoe ampelina]